MDITKKDIDHIAHLARLYITDAEGQMYAHQLSDVFAYMDLLNQLDTEQVAPTNHVTGMHDVLREDCVEDYPDDARERLLAQAERDDRNYICIPHPVK